MLPEVRYGLRKDSWHGNYTKKKQDIPNRKEGRGGGTESEIPYASRAGSSNLISREKNSESPEDCTRTVGRELTETNHHTKIPARVG